MEWKEGKKTGVVYIVKNAFFFFQSVVQTYQKT